MIATIPYIEQRFCYFNQLIFKNQLPAIPILLSRARTFVGQLNYKRHRHFFSKPTFSDFKLRISTRFELTEEELDDTVIHEMIHYYILYNGLKDTSSHGNIFRRMMTQINEQYGRHITISHQSSPRQNEQLIKSRRPFHVVALVYFNDNRTGIKVLPRNRRSINFYINKVSRLQQITKTEIYLTQNPYFNKYPASTALYIHYCEREMIMRELSDSETYIK